LKWDQGAEFGVTKSTKKIVVRGTVGVGGQGVQVGLKCRKGRTVVDNRDPKERWEKKCQTDCTRKTGASTTPGGPSSNDKTREKVTVTGRVQSVEP